MKEMKGKARRDGMGFLDRCLYYSSPPLMAQTKIDGRELPRRKTACRVEWLGLDARHEQGIQRGERERCTRCGCCHGCGCGVDGKTAANLRVKPTGDGGQPRCSRRQPRGSLREARGGRWSSGHASLQGLRETCWNLSQSESSNVRTVQDIYSSSFTLIMSPS